MSGALRENSCIAAGHTLIKAAKQLDHNDVLRIGHFSYPSKECCVVHDAVSKTMYGIGATVVPRFIGKTRLVLRVGAHS